jgi:plasmid stability protein
MPKMLQVRNVPDDVHTALKARAAKEGMSLSAFALRELQRVAARPSMQEVLSRAAARGGQVSLADAVDVIRAEREARDDVLVERARSRRPR